jgi:predicted HicB family RNase H-like nuclease
MRKAETLSLRVSSDFKKRLFEEAKKDNRSVTNYLETTLTELWKTKSEKRVTSKKQQ